MSECPVEEELSGFIDGELPPERAAAVQAHVAQCPRCAAEAASLREVASLNESLAAPAVSPQEWAAAWSAIAERTVRRARRTAARPPWLRQGLRWALLAAGALVIGVLAGVLSRVDVNSPKSQAVRPESSIAPAPEPPQEPKLNGEAGDGAEGAEDYVEFVDDGEAYSSYAMYHEEAGTTVITVYPAEPEEPSSNGGI